MSILNIGVVGLVHYMTSPIGAWIVSAVILVVAFLLLTKLNASDVIEKRSYRYAS